MTCTDPIVYLTPVEQDSHKNVGSIADYDPMNERFGSLTQGYAPKPGEQHHEWEEQVPQTRGQGRSQGQCLWYKSDRYIHTNLAIFPNFLGFFCCFSSCFLDPKRHAMSDIQYSRTPVERPPSPTTIPLIRPHFVWRTVLSFCIRIPHERPSLLYDHTNVIMRVVV